MTGHEEQEFTFTPCGQPQYSDKINVCFRLLKLWYILTETMGTLRQNHTVSRRDVIHTNRTSECCRVRSYGRLSSRSGHHDCGFCCCFSFPGIHTISHHVICRCCSTISLCRSNCEIQKHDLHGSYNYSAPP